jgi:hypothetical protein
LRRAAARRHARGAWRTGCWSQGVEPIFARPAGARLRPRKPFRCHGIYSRDGNSFFSFASSRSEDVVSHSQTVKTSQPRLRSWRSLRRSRFTFSRNFGSQYSRRVFGVVAFGHPVWRCQKQPCTKIAVRCLNYKPARDAVGHTALLTSTAKAHLNLTFQNIRARVKTLLGNLAD